jgi:hypothetical protein
MSPPTLERAASGSHLGRFSTAESIQQVDVVYAETIQQWLEEGENPNMAGCAKAATVGRTG